MKSKLIFLLFLSIFYSCSKKCQLKPIPNNVFDLEKIERKTVILKCGNETDSLIFNDKYDIYTNESFKGLMKYEECGHSRAYKYNFRNETIQVCLNKNDKEVMEIELFGWFNKFSDNRIVTEKDMLDKKEYIFTREENRASAKSQIKKVTLKGYEIKSIITLDNKVWVIH